MKQHLTNSELDDCQLCYGANGGVKGNENIVGGVAVCDYCTVKLNGIIKAETARLQWQPITPENMPKVGDEVTDGRIVLNCNASMGQRTYAEWTGPYERTYFRPFDPPKPKEAS